jgi:asparagine synthetase B (glutamine-hydrolysing)
MCGIVRILGFDGSKYRVDEVMLGSMRDTMVHRGPAGGIVE